MQRAHDTRRCRYCREASKAGWLCLGIAACICVLAVWAFMQRWAGGLNEIDWECLGWSAAVGLACVAAAGAWAWWTGRRRGR